MKTIEESTRTLEVLAGRHPESREELRGIKETLCQYEDALREAARVAADLLEECNLANGMEPSGRERAASRREEFLDKWRAHAGLI